MILQLTNIKEQHTTIGLPHLSTQFFSSVDEVITKFLSPIILSWQRFQISQSFTYEGQLVSNISEVCNRVTISLYRDQRNYINI